MKYRNLKNGEKLRKTDEILVTFAGCFGNYTRWIEARYLNKNKYTVGIAYNNSTMSEARRLVEEQSE